jgi:very-short-patch-repair endonuclease
MADQLTLRRRARAVRAEPTWAEAQLWKMLRAGRFRNPKFRRQVPLGNYIADFFCAAHRLVVEADGGAHCDPEYDRVRDEWFRSQGIRAPRFRNETVASDETALAILAACRRFESS